MKITAICAACILGGGVIGGSIVSIGQNRQQSLQVQEPTALEAANGLAPSDLAENGTDTGKHFSMEEATRKLGDDKQALSVAEIFKQVSPAVVSITSTGVNSRGQAATSSGSGVIISQDGYIVTNNHVIEGAQSISVKTEDGDRYDATLIGRDSATEVAVLKIEGGPFAAAAIGDSDSLEVGELAVAIGNPLGELSNSLTAGFISATNRSVAIDTSVSSQMNFIQTDVAISPGNSGGALINSYGELVGITTAKSIGDGVEGIGYALPINDVMDVAEDLINNGRVTGRPQIGISVSTVTEEIAQAYNWPIGVRIEEVTAGSAAEEGGLMVGDIIVALNGHEVVTYDDLSELKSDIQVGDSFTFTLYRKGEKTTVTVVMGEDPGDTDEPAQENAASENGYGDGAYNFENMPPEIREFFESLR